MRKVLPLTMIILSVFLLTGCTTKTLKCERTKEEGGTKTLENITIEFQKDEARKLTLYMSMTLNDNIKEYINTMKLNIDASYIDLVKSVGVKYDSKILQNKIIVDIKADFKEMDSKAKKALPFADDNNFGYDKTKRDIENEGYTCK